MGFEPIFTVLGMATVKLPQTCGVLLAGMASYWVWKYGFKNPRSESAAALTTVLFILIWYMYLRTQVGHIQIKT